MGSVGMNSNFMPLSSWRHWPIQCSILAGPQKGAAVQRLKARCTGPHARSGPHCCSAQHLYCCHPSLVCRCVHWLMSCSYPVQIWYFPSKNTAILSLPAKLMLAGLPLMPVLCIAGAVFRDDTIWWTTSPLVQVTHSSLWWWVDMAPFFFFFLNSINIHLRVQNPT